MGAIEREETLPTLDMADHMRNEIEMNARRILARNNELKNEVSQRPGAEEYLFDLEKIKEEVEKIKDKY